MVGSMVPYTARGFNDPRSSMHAQEIVVIALCVSASSSNLSSSIDSFTQGWSLRLVHVHVVGVSYLYDAHGPDYCGEYADPDVEGTRVGNFKSGV